jgi:hypothetical protein
MPGRDAGEIEALVTDRYLDALLAGEADLMLLDAGAGRPRGALLDAAVRAASRRLAADLPRFHPSFRFEERLALTLAEAAANMPRSGTAGAGGVVDASGAIEATGGIDVIGRIRSAGTDALDHGDRVAALADDPAEQGFAGPDDADRSPLFLRGAVAASALSLAGAAWYAWRHRPSASPMARAARAAHAAHPSRRQLTGSGRV